MSVAETNGDEPRRGSRQRKQPERFEHVTGNNRGGDDDEQSDASDDEPPKRGKRKANGKPKEPKAKVAKPRKAAATVPATDAEVVEGFKTDSSLFNALLQPDVAIQPLVEDWVHTYQGAAGDGDAEKAAVQELVLLFIRACGFGADVDEDEAMDQDGVVDVIERIQDESVNTNPATYPLISRVKSLRSFKTNLSAVISHLVATLFLTPHLFDDAETTKHSLPLVPLLLTWLHSMASSPLRPIRHTATFITLKINSALCDAAATASNELSIKQRQREAEAKKSGSGAAAKKRLKEAEDKVKEAHERKTRLEEYMTEIFDVMFVHRVRDADPAIRTDCIRELGVWVKTYGEKYVSTSYLNYFVRGSNDPDGNARLETVKALAGLFSNPSTANHVGSFTLRIAPRLIQMASRDVETPVRINAVNVITAIDRTGALQDEDEEQREKVTRLIFDEQPRVRKAAAGFVRGLWEDRVEVLSTEFGNLRAAQKKRAGAAATNADEMKQRFEWKALASLLVETSKSLNEPSEEASSSKQVVPLAAATGSATTRAAAAAEALLGRIELVQRWQELVPYLLLDHSTSDEDIWLLTEEEEDFLLEVLVTVITDYEDEDEDEKTKALIKVLPRLFAKHQAEVKRIVGVLSIPQHMNLSLYLDLRKGAAYESLWDDITKQFLQHTDAAVQSAAIAAIKALNDNTSMAAVNARKTTELEEALFSSLRDAVDGEDVAAMSIDEDKLTALEAILLRIHLVSTARDIVTAMEDEEGGQSSGWTIVNAFAGRGGLGFREEAKMVEHALRIIFSHVAWLGRRLSASESNDEAAIDSFNERRDAALELFERFGVRDRTNAADTTRREAFIAFINLHILFCKARSPPPSIVLEMATDKQHKLGGAFSAAVDRYVSDLDDAEQEGEDEDSIESAQRDYTFLQMVAVFVGAIRVGVLDIEQAKEPLAHYGRFDDAYDSLVRTLADSLRNEGIYNRDATTVQHVIGEALQNSFNVFLDSDDHDPDATVALARFAASAFVVQGTHFTILKQIHPGDVYDLHINAIDWVFRKISALVKQQAQKESKEAKARINTKRGQLYSFFRPLALLLGPIVGRDALRIRAHLESVVDGSGAAVQTRASAAYKAYEKRLVSAAGKDTAPKAQPTRAAPRPQKSAAIVEDDEDEDEANGDEAEINGDVDVVEENGGADEIEASADQPADEVEVDEVEEFGATPSSQPALSQKRPLEDESVVLDFEPGEEGNFDAEIDLAFGSSPAASAASRDRSVSIEPTAKKRKTVNKY
ncbi:cohesin complex subunit [Vanrija albida]|uniref:Cohesin complex subunit n=1 Tax=Vanrija albida TaxID=181172 RepID=A0ABR3Q504_9TREE